MEKKEQKETRICILYSCEIRFINTFVRRASEVGERAPMQNNLSLISSFTVVSDIQ